MRFVCAIFLSVCSLPIGRLHAQRLNPRILVIADNQYSRAQFITASKVDLYYTGEIDTASTVPSDLMNFDAVFLLFLNQGFLDSASSMRLVTYLSNKGQLYAESPLHFLSWFGPNDSMFHPQDSIWLLTGLDGEFSDFVYDYYDSILGVDSEFTSGINIQEGRMGASQSSTYYPHGSIVNVLYGLEDGFAGHADVFAWIPADTSIRAVLHHPISARNEYYSTFLRRVLCNHFGLCQPDVLPKRSVSFDLIDRGQGTPVKEIYDVIGKKVAEVRESKSLPSGLPNGLYFLKRIESNGVTIKPVVIQN